MKKEEILSYVGSIQQLAYVRPFEYKEGRASALKAYFVKNGELSFQVMIDKCLDISEFSYQGQNVNFLSKPGLNGRNHFDTNGQEALRSIMGGLFFTCGLENISSPCKIDGKDYPMHGRMRTTPAEHVSADAYWDGDDYFITISGEMREAELFGENMVLRRTIKTKYGEKRIIISDEIENQSFREEPMMLMYHFNIGYPMLTPNSKIIIPSKNVMPRDAISELHLDDWDCMEEPKENETEYVFIHELKADDEGNTFAAVINEDTNTGIKLGFNKKYLPYFMEWKSIAAGDYVLGLEPSNSSVYGREYHVKNNNLHMMAPFECEHIEIIVSILDGKKEIETIKNLIG